MKAIKKKFAMSNANLAMFVSNLVITMTRDTTEFAARGVDAAAITAFETLGNEFEVFPPDEYYLGQVMTAVYEKDVVRETVTANIQFISGFIEQKWGLKSGEYKQLSIKDLQVKTDRMFLVTARTVVTVANDYLLDLTAEGLTQADIDTLESNAQLFEDALNNVGNKKKLRDDKVEERIIKGNELYSYTSKYCRIGKLIWENVDESKYNDYIMYPKKKNLPGKVVGMAYDLTTGQCTWTAVADALTYELQYAPDMPSPIFTTVYEGPDLGFVYNPGGPDNYLFRCRAVNADGAGEWSDVLIVVRP